MNTFLKIIAYFCIGTTPIQILIVQSVQLHVAVVAVMVVAVVMVVVVAVAGAEPHVDPIFAII